MVNGVSSPAHQSFGFFSGFGINPAQTLSSSTTAYVVTTVNENSALIFSLTGVPPNMPQPTQTTVRIESMTTGPAPVNPIGSVTHNGDQVVLESIFREGVLWFTIEDGCTPAGDNTLRDCVHLSEINVSTMSVIQDFDFGTKGVYQFDPALSVDGSGNVDVIFGYSNSTTYPSLAMASHSASAPAGLMLPAVTLIRATTVQGSGVIRWGDYYGASVDPSDTTAVWGVGEYGTSSNWATRIGKMTLS